jgi:hypothetical protein
MPNIYTQLSELNAPVNPYIIVMFPTSAKSWFMRCITKLDRSCYASYQYQRIIV